MTHKTIAICRKYMKLSAEQGHFNCHESCPLSKSCKEQEGDTYAIIADRMNKHSESVEFKGFQ